MYLVQNQFQLMCGWVLVVNGSFPHYTFERVWTLHHHQPSVLIQDKDSQNIYNYTIIHVLNGGGGKYIYIYIYMDFGNHLLCDCGII